MDDKEIAVSALALLGATIECHTEQGISTPAFYEALDKAIELSLELGIPELTTRLQCLQMECGEVQALLEEKAKVFAEKFESLGKLLDNLTDEAD